MISAVVITKNEQDRIQACVESIKWADEIIICDNGSTDKTLEVLSHMEYPNIKIYRFNGGDFASVRNRATEKASGDWVFYIDADERVLEPLREEINVMVGLPDFSAFAISRKNIIFGKEVGYGPFWPDWVIRLLKRKDFKEWVGKVHEQPGFKGKLGYSKNSLLHLTHRNIDQIVLKSLEWSRIDAKLRLETNHPKMSGWRFLRIFVTEVLKQGILRRGFFNGTIGVMDSMLQAFSMYITYVRLWEMQQPKSIDELYEEIDRHLIENNFKY